MMSRLPVVRVAVGILACAMLTAFAPTSSEPVSEKESDIGAFKAALEAFVSAVDAEDCSAIIDSVQTILAFDRVSNLGVEAIEELGLGGTACAVEEGDLELADAIATQTTEQGAMAPWLWSVRFEIPYFDDRPEDALAVLQKMARASTAAVDELKPEFLYRLDDQLAEKDFAQGRNWLLALATSGAYQPSGVLTSVDGFRSRYARLLTRQGDVSAASAQIAAIERTHTLAGIYADPQLAPLLPPALDLRANAEAEVKKMRQAVMLHTDRLKPVVYLSGALRAVGEYQDARALLEEIKSKGSIGENFVDADEHENWFWDELGRTEMALGHADAAVVAYEAGAEVGRETNDRVSQAINLAHAYVDLRRPEEALDVLARERPDERNISPFGIMQVRLARGCANTMLGNEVEALSDLDAMIEHREDGEGALAYLYLCRGDMDAAADIYIRQLQDPDEQANARLDLAEFAPYPDGAIRPIYTVALNELRMRPDVQAALKDVGGMLHIPLQTIDF